MTYDTSDCIICTYSNRKDSKMKQEKLGTELLAVLERLKREEVRKYNLGHSDEGSMLNAMLVGYMSSMMNHIAEDCPRAAKYIKSHMQFILDSDEASRAAELDAAI